MVCYAFLWRMVLIGCVPYGRGQACKTFSLSLKKVAHGLNNCHCSLQFIRVSGINNLPVWFEAGATKFDFANTTALFFVQLLLMG